VKKRRKKKKRYKYIKDVLCMGASDDDGGWRTERPQEGGGPNKNTVFRPLTTSG
jgi:hypothetical protein